MPATYYQTDFLLDNGSRPFNPASALGIRCMDSKIIYEVENRRAEYPDRLAFVASWSIADAR